MIRVLPADPAFAEPWARMRHALWPDESLEELRQEVNLFIAGRSRHLAAVLLAHEADGAPVGFAELNIRPYAEGCVTDRVAFLEGWFVEPSARGRGAGAALIRAAEEWAVANGCTEFASDARFENEVGRAAHLAVGFEQVEVIRCFRKTVAPRRR